MSVIEIFEQIHSEDSFVAIADNGSDCLIYPYIPEGVRNDVRTNFGISRDETILLVRDTGFWNSRDQGLVVTDSGLYCIPDNDNPQLLSFGWDSIVDVQYQELCLYFIDSNGEETPIHIDYFIKSSDDLFRDMEDIAGEELASVFKQIAESVEPAEDPLDAFLEIYNGLMEQQKYQEAIDYCFMHLGYNVIDQSTIYYLLCRIYTVIKDWNKCVESAQNGIEICIEEGNNYLKINFQYTLYSAYHFLELNAQARKECLSVLLNATNQTEGKVLIKDDATNDFQELEEIYKNEFLALPYNERKVVMPVKQYVDLHQERIAVIDIQNLPAINFPMGHPVANQLYVGHPLLPSKYIPFENYQLELVEDRVREFCMLAQSLEATEISVECLNATSTDQNNSMQQNSNAGANTWVTDAKGNLHKDNSRHMMEELSRSVSLHQTFVPHSKPFVPEGMVWYDNEPSWQRLVSQRLNGSMTSHEERIETKKSQMVEGRELLDIKAEVETLFADMNIAFDKTEESKFTQQENAVLSIKVKFAPLSQLTDEAESTTMQIASDSFHALTSAEQEYLNELKEILADGEISPRERRLLDRIRIQSGISDERAAELEAYLAAPRLTAEEQEYLNEYKEIIAEGEVTEKERRLLDKILRMNGISNERAKEIEAIAKR